MTGALAPSTMVSPARALVLLLLVLVAPASAQTRLLDQYRFEAWTGENGLPEGSANGLVRTPDGFLWVGTTRGLFRFDGVRFTPAQESGTPWLRNREITTLIEDGEGGLWIGTEGGGVARYRDGLVTVIGVAEGLPDLSVSALTRDRHGRIWVGTSDGATMFDGASVRTLSDHRGRVHAFLERPDGSIYIGGNVWGLTVWRDGAHHPAPGQLAALRPYALLDDGRGGVWAGEMDGLVDITDVERPRREPSMQGHYVSTMARDARGRVWIGTLGSGLHVMEQGRIERVEGAADLPEDAVRQILPDADGSVWFGLRDGLGRMQTRLLRTARPREHSLMWAVHAEADGTVLAGGNGGLFRIARDRTTVTQLPFLRGMVIDLLRARNGDLWVGLERGVVRVTTEGTSVVIDPATPRGRIRSLFEDRDGTIWIAHSDAGVGRVDGGRFVPLAFPAGHESRVIWAIAQDRSGALWFGGQKLLRYADGQFRVFGEAEGLHGNDIISITADGDDLWIGGYTVALIHYRAGRFTEFGPRQPELRAQAYSTTIAGDDLWVSTNSGLQRLSRQELLAVVEGRRQSFGVRTFDRTDGLFGVGFLRGGQHGTARTSDGHLWFANAGGIVNFDPEDGRLRPTIAPVQLEQVVVDGRAMAPGARLDLAHGEGRQRLGFVFTSPFLATPRRLRFRYLLEGYDRDWVEAGQQRSAEYTNLPGRDYRFRVQAFEEGDVPGSGPELSMPIGLPKYYWEQWWFAALLAGLGGAVALAAHRMRLARVQRLTRQLQDTVDTRTRELREAHDVLEQRVVERTTQLADELAERKHLERQLVQTQKLDSIGRLAGGIAHDLNNLLTVILGYSSFAEKGARDRVRDDIRQISVAGERAASLTQQLLAFSRRQPVEPRNLDLNGIIRDLEPMLRRVIGEHIELAVVLDRGLWTARADPSQVEQVLVNLVINARDAMPEGGRLTIATGNTTRTASALDELAAAAGDYVTFTVRDTGTGISDDVKERMFEPFFTTKPMGKGTGLGLATCYGIIKQASGTIAVDSILGHGTELRVSLPRVVALPDTFDDDIDDIVVAPRRRTILVAEDEPLVRAMTVRTLTDLGHEVLVAADGQEALEVAAGCASPVDLVVTDLVMPRLGGLELAARLRERWPEVLILFVSGFDERALDAELPPDSSLMAKPLRPVALARRVQDVLERRRSAIRRPAAEATSDKAGGVVA